MNTHTAICDYFQLDPAHYDQMTIEPLTEGCIHQYRISWLDGSVDDWFFTFDDDGTVLDGYCYNEVIRGPLL